MSTANNQTCEVQVRWPSDRFFTVEDSYRNYNDALNVGRFIKRATPLPIEVRINAPQGTCEVVGGGKGIKFVDRSGFTVVTVK
jgi:hypothetical protein